ncbi:integrase [Xanthomonas cucurbitae]|uniref:Integrase n=1 Tax=Xanthomonas cucurbitae TaxID=56453 RepID=A0A2S7DYC2_9XANT|nr:site-specific integrase [Xanthomonas cucurbitae]PPU78837.1 integrase [Xanthomonas cucurbitae]
MPKPFLLKRPSGLYARFLVPVDLRERVGSRFLVRALPGRGDTARLAAAQMAVSLSELFATARRGAAMTDDMFKKALAALQGNATRPYTIRTGSGGLELSADGPEDHARLMEALRAIPNMPAPVAKPDSPMLSERAAIHIGEMKRVGRSSKNVLDTEHTLSLFVALVGDKPVQDYKPDDVRAFLKAIESYPSNASKMAVFANLAPIDILKKAQAGDYAKLSMRTKEKHRDRVAAFFNALANEDLISKAPHKAIINRSKAVTDEPSREPFSQAELAALFDPEAFTTWASKYPHRWFGTLLGLATGARVNEIGQLYTDDISKVAGQWGVHYRVTRPDQRLKNPHSSRFVPLPTKLIDAGFLTYLEEVKAAGHERIFPHLPFSKDNGYGDALGDQFRAYAIKQGLTQRLKSFHCFRHTLSNSLINEHGVSPLISQQITGHELTLPAGLKHYVDPPSIPARHRALELFGPPIALPAYLAGQFDQSFKRVGLRGSLWVQSSIFG